MLLAIGNDTEKISSRKFFFCEPFILIVSLSSLALHEAIQRRSAEHGLDGLKLIAIDVCDVDANIHQTFFSHRAIFLFHQIKELGQCSLGGPTLRKPEGGVDQFFDYFRIDGFKISYLSFLFHCG